MITLFSWFNSLPLTIRIYISIGLFFLAISLVFVLAIQVSQLLKRVNTRFKRRYMDEIQKEISLLVVQSSMSEVPEASFRFKLERLISLTRKSDYLAQLILNEIVSMKKNLVGESAVYLKRAYLELGLFDLSVKKVRSRNWKRIAKGLRELEIMEQVDALHHFIIFLNHSNYYLRREARLSLAGLAPNPMFFLDNFSESLSDWEKLLLFEKLKRRPREVIPDFSKWYYHQNYTVVTFCIEMTVQFGQVHNIEKLEHLLTISNHQLRCLIVDALRRMEAIQSLEIVSEILKKATTSKMIIACLKFIGSIGDDSFSELLQPFARNSNLYVRLEAVRALTEIDGKIDLTSFAINSMLSHIKHPLIV